MSTFKNKHTRTINNVAGKIILPGSSAMVNLLIFLSRHNELLGFVWNVKPEKSHGNSSVSSAMSQQLALTKMVAKKEEETMEEKAALLKNMATSRRLLEGWSCLIHNLFHFPIIYLNPQNILVT